MLALLSLDAAMGSSSVPRLPAGSGSQQMNPCASSPSSSRRRVWSSHSRPCPIGPSKRGASTSTGCLCSVLAVATFFAGAAGSSSSASSGGCHCFDVIISLGLGAIPTEEAEAPLRELELKMSIRRPAYNRKLLGVWATVVAEGRVVAAPSVDAQASQATAGVASRRGALQVPATVEIRRDGSRRTKQHRYGTIDENLEEGERLRITTRSAVAAAAGEPLVRAASATFEIGLAALEAASALDELASVEQSLGKVFDVEAFPGPIAYLSSYLAVVRRADGRLVSLLARVDEPDE